jgi:hypothetical protein
MSVPDNPGSTAAPLDCQAQPEDGHGEGPIPREWSDHRSVHLEPSEVLTKLSNVCMNTDDAVSRSMDAIISGREGSERTLTLSASARAASRYLIAAQSVQSASLIPQRLELRPASADGIAMTRATKDKFAADPVSQVKR